MRRRERAEDEPKGGLVADHMGLGSKFYSFLWSHVDDDFRRDNTNAGKYN